MGLPLTVGDVAEGNDEEVGTVQVGSPELADALPLTTGGSLGTHLTQAPAVTPDPLPSRAVVVKDRCKDSPYRKMVPK